jgi:hypothetical protein
MKPISSCISAAFLLAVGLAIATADELVKPSGIAALQQSFRQPPDDSRPMMRWWWFGPAVTRTELEREMRLMKEGGIGGFEVQPVYPLAPDDNARSIRNLSYLSKEFLDMLRFASDKARELGLRMDLTLGSGWPYGGSLVSVDQAAARLRWERVPVKEETRRVPVPDIAEGESLIAAFAGGWRERLDDVKDGVLWLSESGPRPGEVWFFIASRTGQQVKRAAYGAEGFVMDHYSRTSLRNYLDKVGEPMLKALSAHPPYAIFCDSLEVYGGDWTDDFVAQFQRRRGYDIRLWLPALVTELGPETAAVRRDWGKTLTELLDERFIEPLQQWARAHHTKFRLQGYGAPPANISVNAHADLNEGEGHPWDRLTATRWASSVSHLFGRTITSSETWTWLHSPVFRATPLDLKAEADRHFLSGINQLVGHGWPYTAEGVGYPGWRFYASGVYNEKNPWWIVMPDLSRYLQRVSFLLRQGKPVSDVALFLPTDDAYAHFVPGQVNLFDTLRQRMGTNVVSQILEAGYGFDFFDDGTLGQVGKVDKGALVMGGNRYRAVVLPEVESIPLATVRKLVEFARSGGVLIATRRLPDTAPGLTTPDTEKAEVRETVRSLFDPASGPARLVANEAELGAALNARLMPDISLSPAVPDIGFVHRRTDSAEIFFVVNTDNVTHKTKVAFRVEGMEPDCLDPMTGNARPLAVTERNSGSTMLELNFEPYASRVLVFYRRAPQPVPDNAPTQAALDLSSGWQVKFGDKAVPVKMETLRSWTADESTRYFSGVATYEKTFAVPENLLRTGARVKLDFGEAKPSAAVLNPRVNSFEALVDAPVREAAVVTVNGHRAGSVWCPPYSVDMTEYLKRGENQLQIVVGNLALNYMAGHALPDYKLLNMRYGERFQAQDMDKVQPIPAGLIGPIRLLATESAAR